MSVHRSSYAIPPPALQPTVLPRTPLATTTIRRTNHTDHPPLSTPYRSNIPAHGALVIQCIGTLSTARHIAIAQIPIAHHLD